MKPEIDEAVDSAIKHYLEISKHLKLDLDAILEMNQEASSQPWRRNIIRATWSLVDGYVYSLQKICARANDLLGVELSKPQAQAISHGKQSHKEMIKHTILAAEKIFEIGLNIDFSSSLEWRGVVRSIELRHEIVHPKELQDFVVTDDRWEEHIESFTWLINQIDAVVTLASDDV